MIYKLIIMDDDGDMVAEMVAGNPEPLIAIMQNHLGILEEDINSEDPWWTFLHSLPAVFKLSEHVGSVMEMFGSRSFSPHAAEAFKAELGRRIRKDTAI